MRLAFNEGSQWRAFWPILVITPTIFEFAIFIFGKYRRVVFMKNQDGWKRWSDNETRYVFVVTHGYDGEGGSIEGLYETEEAAAKHPLPFLRKRWITKFPVLKQAPPRKSHRCRYP